MPRRRFPYNADGMASLDVRIQAQSGPEVDLIGIVDSGASTTVLSRRHAEKLGLGPVDLREAGTIGVADGSKVHCWTAVVPIRAQVLELSSLDALLPWGPVFALNAIFLEHAIPLLGQADFMATFRVTLARDVSPAWFELGHQGSL